MRWRRNTEGSEQRGVVGSLASFLSFARMGRETTFTPPTTNQFHQGRDESLR